MCEEQISIWLVFKAALKQVDQERRSNLDAAVELAETLCTKDIRESKDTCAAAGSEPLDTPKNQAWDKR